MYEYRKMSEAERKEILAWRHLVGLPLHAPPHYPDGLRVYLITAVCYEHRHILHEENRRVYFAGRLLEALSALPNGEIHAWVVLPNHYHALITVDLALLSPVLARLHNGTATEWNRADGTPGRKVWFRFSDRSMRNEGHYYASLNYVHANAVKHGYALKASDWRCSSVHDWLELYGRDYLVGLWAAHPVGHYGQGWDDV